MKQKINSDKLKLNTKISKLAARIKDDPGDSFSKFALALELIKIDQKEKALGLFLNIKQTDPDYVGVYYHLAKLLEEFNENKKALETYNLGIQIATEMKHLHAKSELESALLNLELEMEE